MDELELENVTWQDLEMIYLTVWYKCGCPMMRGIRRFHATSRQLMGHDRIISTGEKCQNHNSLTAAKLAAERERKMESYG